MAPQRLTNQIVQPTFSLTVHLHSMGKPLLNQRDNVHRYMNAVVSDRMLLFLTRRLSHRYFSSRGVVYSYTCYFFP